MRVSGRRAYTREVPGTCNIGKMGVTFSYPQVGAGGKRPYLNGGGSVNGEPFVRRRVHTTQWFIKTPSHPVAASNKHNSRALVPPRFCSAETSVFFPVELGGILLFGTRILNRDGHDNNNIRHQYQHQKQNSTRSKTK